MTRFRDCAALGALALLPVQEASACGICIYEEVQPYFPPVVVWSVLTVFAWPIAFYVTSAGGGGVAGRTAAITASALAIPLALVLLGPIPFALLLGLSVFRLARARQRGADEAVRRLTWALVVAFVVSGVWTTVRLRSLL